MIALFSIENQYDQPDNNLVALFKEKPSIELLAKALGKSFPCDKGSDTSAIVNIWNNKSKHEYRLGDFYYRLEEVNFYE